MLVYVTKFAGISYHKLNIAVDKLARQFLSVNKNGHVRVRDFAYLKFTVMSSLPLRVVIQVSAVQNYFWRVLKPTTIQGNSVSKLSKRKSDLFFFSTVNG